MRDVSCAQRGGCASRALRAAVARCGARHARVARVARMVRVSSAGRACSCVIAFMMYAWCVVCASAQGVHPHVSCAWRDQYY